MTETSWSEVDVAIIGAGLAGMSLAIQLTQRRPAARVCIFERARFPVPEAVHKVGESTIEVGAHYFANVLGLNHALRPAKLPKLGLRFVFNPGDNPPFEQRPEVGQAHFPVVHTYNFDRGRMENILYEQCRRQGVNIVDGAAVDAIELGTTAHVLSCARGEHGERVSARWVVDASGRRGLLKQKLRLSEASRHHVNATWFRVDDAIAIDDASRAEHWQRRVPFGLRKLSTTHLMGCGYWVWLIPLASGSTSVGIVADEQIHPVVERNSFDKALAWLALHEPQCAEMVAHRRGRLQDFLVLKRLSYGCREVFSHRRWALTGEAGVFLDPFYSPGSDFIAYANDYITALVERDLCGQDIAQAASQFNEAYLNLFESWLNVYHGQYPLMANARVFSAKIVWDFAIYWGASALIYFQRKLTDLDFGIATFTLRSSFHRLHQQAQRFFQWWHARDPGQAPQGAHLDYLSVEFLYAWQTALNERLDDVQLRAALERNLRVCENLLRFLYARATGSQAGLQPDDPRIDPYALRLDDSPRVPSAPERFDLAGELNLFVSRVCSARSTQPLLQHG